MSTRLAADWLPRSGLASSYYSVYSVGFSGIAMALKVGPAVVAGRGACDGCG
jgi:hypothetical protein